MTMSDASEADDERSAPPAVVENALASVEAIQPRIDAYVDRLEEEVASALQDACHLLASYRHRQQTAIDELMARANAEIERAVGRADPGPGLQPQAPTAPPSPVDGPPTALPVPIERPPTAVGPLPLADEPMIDLRDGASDIWEDADRFDEHFDRFWSERPVEIPPVGPDTSVAETEASPESMRSWQATLLAALRDVAVPVLLAIVIIPTVLAVGLAFFAS